jgi:hypothetical protein
MIDRPAISASPHSSRLRPPARVRPHRRSLPSLVTAAVIGAALLCGVAPAASADLPFPSTPKPTSSRSSVVEHPGLHVDVTARFEITPGGLIEAGSPITLTYHFANTGDVALHDIGPTAEELEPGESSSFSTAERRITAHELDAGVVTVSGRWTVRTPTRSWTAPPFTVYLFTR